MELKQPVGVFGVDDKALGRLERVVIDPKSNEVTHLVIRHGIVTTRDEVCQWLIVNRARSVRLHF